MTRGTLRQAYILFAVMTAATFIGPFALKRVVDGGDETGWPPDRPIEWAATFGFVAVVAVVLGLLGRLWLMNIKELHAARERLRRPEAEREGG
jgi:hypothetical protein